MNSEGERVERGGGNINKKSKTYCTTWQNTSGYSSEAIRTGNKSCGAKGNNMPYIATDHVLYVVPES